MRFALPIPRKCSQREVISAVPLLTAFENNLMEWVIPDHTDKDQQFNTRSGMGLFVKVLPHEDTHSSFVESDE